MSRLVFAHDHRFISAGNEIGSVGQFAYPVWLRYLSAFDEVRVIARAEKINQSDLPFWANESQGPGVSFNLLNFNGSAFFMPSFLKQEFIREIVNADAVVARLPSEIGLKAISIAERNNIPFAVEVVGCAWDVLWYYGSPQARLYAPIFWLRTRMAVRKAPFILYVTQSFLQKRYPGYGKTATISNVQINRTVEMPKQYSRREKNDPLVFGFIGSLQTRYKGLHVAISALKYLADRKIPARLRVIGKGDQTSWRTPAEKLGINHLISFEGSLPGGQAVFSWLDEIDVLVQPSFQEGLPRTVIEAMSRGLAVLASSAGGTNEILPLDVLHRPGDVKRLVQHMTKAYNEPDWLSHLARQNLQQARNFLNNTLEQRRCNFWRDFARQLKKNNTYEDTKKTFPS